MTMATLLSVENVYAGYDKADVLQDVSLAVVRQHHRILGPTARARAR